MRMWTRISLVVAVGALIGVVAACDDESDYGYGYGGGSGVRCGDYKACGTCTPVLGCGWCATGNGTGTCVDGPDNCSTAPAGFSWDPTGCGGEGGVSTRDGGHAIAEAGIGTDDDASTNDAASDDGSTNDDASTEAGVDAGSD